MVRTTRKQREAIKRVYDRGDIWWDTPAGKYLVSYREFRRSVKGTICCDGAVTVHWCRMWLCIERDGHVHS